VENLESIRKDVAKERVNRLRGNSFTERGKDRSGGKSGMVEWMVRREGDKRERGYWGREAKAIFHVQILCRQIKRRR